jgi:hypothetical protein
MNVDSRTPEERVDAAIDLAVRDMMDVEPRADLRARVIERIEHPRRAFNWTWVIAPMAATAILILAVILWRPNAMPEPRPAGDIVLRAPARSHEPPSTTTHAPATVRLARRAGAQRRGTVAAFVPPDEPRPTIALEPLRPIDAISVEPVTLHAIDTQRIGVPALTPIPQIELEPVNASGGRN